MTVRTLLTQARPMWRFISSRIGNELAEALHKVSTYVKQLPTAEDAAVAERAGGALRLGGDGYIVEADGVVRRAIAGIARR